MKVSTHLLNIKVTDEQHDTYRRAAEAAESTSLSVWIREGLEFAASMVLDPPEEEGVQALTGETLSVSQPEQATEEPVECTEAPVAVAVEVPKVEEGVHPKNRKRPGMCPNGHYAGVNVKCRMCGQKGVV